MKKLLFALVCSSLLVCCKKSNSKPKKNTPAVRQNKTAQQKLKKHTQKPSLVLAGKMIEKGTLTTQKTRCKIHVKVSGMTCATGCAPQVRTALKGVKGISEAVVSFKTKSAVIDGKGTVCGGKGTQAVIDKVFEKKTYKCKIAKIELFAKANTKAALKKGG